MAVQLFPEFANPADRSQGEKRAAANSNKILLVLSVVTTSLKRGMVRAEEGAGVSAGSCSLGFLGRGWQEEQNNHGEPRGSHFPGSSVGPRSCFGCRMSLKRSNSLLKDKNREEKALRC